MDPGYILPRWWFQLRAELFEISYIGYTSRSISPQFFPWVPSRDIYHFSKCSCCIWIISVQYVLGLGVIPSKDGLCVLECLFRRSIFNSIYRAYTGPYWTMGIECCVQNAVQLLTTFVFVFEICRSSGRRDISL